MNLNISFFPDIRRIVFFIPFLSVILYPVWEVRFYFILNFLIMLCFASFIYWSFKEKKITVPDPGIYLFLFFFIYIFSYLFSPVRDIISAENVSFFSGFLIFFITVNTQDINIKYLYPVFYLILALFFYQQFFYVESLKGNTNLMAFIFIIISGILIEKKRYYHAAVFFVALLLTRSIAGVISVVAGCVFYAIDNVKNIDVKENRFIFLIVVILFISLIFFIDTKSVYDRISWWGAGFRMFAERPFAGWGYSSYTYVVSAFSSHSIMTLYPHNYFISVMCEGGLIAFLLWIIFLFRFLKNVNGISRYVTLSVIIHSFFDIGLDSVCGWWLCMFYFATVVREKSFIFIVSQAYSKIAFTLIAVMLIFIIKFSSYSLNLFDIENTYRSISEISDISDKINTIEKYLRKFPYNIDIARLRTEIYLQASYIDSKYFYEYFKSLEYMLVINPYDRKIYDTLLGYYSKIDMNLYNELVSRKNKYIKSR